MLVFLRERPWSTSPMIRRTLGETEHGSLVPLLRQGRLCRFRLRADAAYHWALAGEPISDLWRSKGVIEEMLETTAPTRRSRAKSEPDVLTGLEGLHPVAEQLLSVALDEAIERLDRDLFELDQALYAVQAQAQQAMARASAIEERKRKLNERRQRLLNADRRGH